MSKRPSFQFYPADWRKDAGLQSCSIGARGLWLECMCIMHECEPYGHLTVNGKAMSAAQIARLIGLPLRRCNQLLDELQVAGVPSKTENGTIFSRRMVKDEKNRGDWRRRQANHRANGDDVTEDVTDSVTSRVTEIVTQPSRPSSSSASSSSSSSERKRGENAASGDAAAPRFRKGTLRRKEETEVAIDAVCGGPADG